MSIQPFFPSQTWSSYDPFFGSRALTTRDPFWSDRPLSSWQDTPASNLNRILTKQQREMQKYNPILNIDIYERDNTYELYADLPGVEGKDLDITVDNDQIKIKATRAHVHDTDTGVTHRQERSFGEVKRTLRLPVDCDANNAQVDFTNAILKVTFPKVARSGRKKLLIK